MGYRTYTCPIAKSCGGCEWLQVPYPIQLKRKQAALEELFRPFLEDGLSISPILGMDEPVHYRHKAATPFAPASHGRIRSGFFAKGTHRIVSCPECLAEDPRCRTILTSVARTAERMHIPAYAEDQGRGLLRHAVVRCGWKTDDVLLTIVANGESLPHERAFVERFLDFTPGVTTIALNTNEKRTNAMLGARTRILHGPAAMRDELLSCRFRIGPASFYQTNPEQTETLYRLAIDAALEGAAEGQSLKVLDAYCGLGTIGICLAHEARKRGIEAEILGVEKGPEAIRLAKLNAQDSHLAGACRFVCDDATSYLCALARQKPHFDIVVLDPPRAGSTPEFLAGVLALAPERVVYISCNPETQVRDLAELERGGYAVSSIEAVDMFPHTKHIETVVSLFRAGNGRHGGRK